MVGTCRNLCKRGTLSGTSFAPPVRLSSFCLAWHASITLQRQRNVSMARNVNFDHTIHRDVLRQGAIVGETCAGLAASISRRTPPNRKIGNFDILIQISCSFNTCRGAKFNSSHSTLDVPSNGRHLWPSGYGSSSTSSLASGESPGSIGCIDNEIKILRHVEGGQLFLSIPSLLLELRCQCLL